MDYSKEMYEKILNLSNPNSNYTMADFKKEFSGLFNNSSNTTDFKLNVSFTNKSNNEDPKYATSGSSGFDLRANLSEPITLKPLSRAIIPTGLFFELPSNTEIQIRPRSGLAAKNGVTVLNTPGTIDSDYRGEIMVILYNSDANTPFVVNNGDRIAQAVVSSCISKNVINLNKVSEINTSTERGDGKFGSTGKN